MPLSKGPRYLANITPVINANKTDVSCDKDKNNVFFVESSINANEANYLEHSQLCR